MSDAAPRTLFDKIWDSHVVEQLPDGTCILYIDRHLLHEVTSPQAFEGLRLAGRKLRRPDLTIAVADHNIPTVGARTPADIKRRGQPHPGPDAGAERRRVRRAVHPDPRCAAGHRAHHRPGTRHQPAGHHHRLRRLAHLDARRAGGAGVRHRHLRGRARDGDADAAAAAGEEHAGAGGWHAGLRLLGQGHRAGDHRQDRHCRRHRPRDRIHRRGDPRARHGRAHDGVQHDDRGRRAGWADRAGRDHVRLHQGARIRAEGRGVGAGGGLLAHAAVRSRRALRHDGGAECRRDRADGDVGHQSGRGGAGHRRGA